MPYSGIVDVSTVSKILRNYKLFASELLDKQLGQMIQEKNKNTFISQRKVALLYPFLCLTDTNLGKPWKTIIEEVVKCDISCKKAGRETRVVLMNSIFRSDGIILKRNHHI